MKKKIGIILEFGFHDLKKYIYSDFGKKLGEHFDIVWLAIQKESDEFHRLFSETGYPIVYFNQSDFITPSKLEAINIPVRRAWMSKKKLGLFHNYRSIHFKKFKKTVLGSQVIKEFFEIVTLKYVNKRYFNNKLKLKLQECGINLIIGTGYSSSFSKSVFVTANKIGLSTYLLINNWKDLYINNFIPYKFVNTIFVWDASMKNDCLFHMPYLNKDKILITGNPVFDSLRKSKPKFSRFYYAKKYNIDIEAYWIYYTMMSPLSGFDEIKVVKLIGKEILKVYDPKKLVILLRKNPQHSKEDFTTEIFPDNIVLTEHFSYFDKARDMHTQTPEGEQEWIDLLHHCSMNFSVPSTVTLEFLALNKPVLNICFGPDGKTDPRLKQHFEAGYYRNIFNDKRVIKVERIYDFLRALESIKKVPTMESINEDKNFAADIIIQRMLHKVIE